MLLTVIVTLSLAKLSCGKTTVEEQTQIRLDQVRHAIASSSTIAYPKYTFIPIVRTIPNGTVLEESPKQSTTATVINVVHFIDMTSTSSPIPPIITTTPTINPATPTTHTKMCGLFTAAKRCMTKDAAARCVMVDSQPHCVCSEEWSGKYCGSKIQAVQPRGGRISDTAIDRVFFILFGVVIVLTVVIIIIIEEVAVYACLRRCPMFKQQEQQH
ncbi:hypothetical protein PRIPAC_96375 [Pristionchus pacificus]|uniref:EGF-like domain-containing protein n=1 Tax=Pristionchus pacificus TaxID=54126 RepID=A0A2A6D1G9_PRIPA|nr:hypothetical protein PRIPAC_96375 [Pristionchus pacificus]|eukprot:PDM84186.1 hypothetical protein PRIPAC_33209 [Pristionchus pacificus]